MLTFAISFKQSGEQKKGKTSDSYEESLIPSQEYISLLYFFKCTKKLAFFRSCELNVPDVSSTIESYQIVNVCVIHSIKVVNAFLI